MPNIQKVGRFLLLTGIAICLLQIWLPAYYLTADGPCHVYNAQILHDLWGGANQSFYQKFYTPVYDPNPNWFSTFVLAVLMYAVKGIVAEKILLSLYILFFAGGFYLLLRHIDKSSSLWVLAILVLIFPHVLTKGFYNFSFGIAFYFWVVWSWLRFMERPGIKFALLFLLFLGLIFFAHLLGFALAVGTCALLAVSLSASAAPGARMSMFLKRIGILMLLTIPFVVLVLWFTNKEGGMQLQLRPHLYRLQELVEGKHLVNFNHNEFGLTKFVGGIIFLLFAFTLLKFKASGWVHKYDGLLWSFFVVLLVYFLSPEDVLGRAMDMSVRMQIFALILAACCIAYRLKQQQVKTAAAIGLFGCFLVLTFLRMTCSREASQAQSTCMEAANVVRPFSVILPINLASGGVNKQGNEIADWNFSFRHAVQYFALDKPLVVLDNYEANAGYFPIQWRPNVNPYHYLSFHAGIEGAPPSARIKEYTKATGVEVDYVLIWNFNSRFLSNSDFSTLYEEVRANYHAVYNSADGSVHLLERNGRPG